MYCPNCMKKIDDNSSFCPKCGKAVNIKNPDNALPIGTVLADRYYVGTVLGQGGFGITYAGCDTRLDKKVAIKEYYPSGIVNRFSEHSTNLSVNAGNVSDVFEHEKEKFINEAHLLAKFSSEKNIVNVSDVFSEHNTAYMVMEYVEGQTLAQYIKENGKVSFSSALYMLEPMMRSLSEIHKEGLIHRDISPANIMVQKDGTVTLLDFGSAREFDESMEKSMSVILKHGYAPAEQYMTKGVQGPWTDVYAICATIYRMITGVTPASAVDRTYEDVLKKPSELGAIISADEEAALLKGLAVFQKDRISSIEELISALKGKAEKTPVIPVEQQMTAFEQTEILGKGTPVPNVAPSMQQAEAPFDMTQAITPGNMPRKSPSVNQNIEQRIQEAANAHQSNAASDHAAAQQGWSQQAQSQQGWNQQAQNQPQWQVGDYAPYDNGKKKPKTAVIALAAVAVVAVCIIGYGIISNSGIGAHSAIADESLVEAQGTSEAQAATNVAADEVKSASEEVVNEAQSASEAVADETQSASEAADEAASSEATSETTGGEAFTTGIGVYTPDSLYNVAANENLTSYLYNNNVYGPKSTDYVFPDRYQNVDLNGDGVSDEFCVNFYQLKSGSYITYSIEFSDGTIFETPLFNNGFPNEGQHIEFKDLDGDNIDEILFCNFIDGSAGGMVTDAYYYYFDKDAYEWKEVELVHTDNDDYLQTLHEGIEASVEEDRKTSPNVNIRDIELVDKGVVVLLDYGMKDGAELTTDFQGVMLLKDANGLANSGNAVLVSSYWPKGVV